MPPALCSQSVNVGKELIELPSSAGAEPYPWPVSDARADTRACAGRRGFRGHQEPYHGRADAGDADSSGHSPRRSLPSAYCLLIPGGQGRCRHLCCKPCYRCCAALRVQFTLQLGSLSRPRAAWLTSCNLLIWSIIMVPLAVFLVLDDILG